MVSFLTIFASLIMTMATCWGALILGALTVEICKRYQHLRKEAAIVAGTIFVCANLVFWAWFAFNENPLIQAYKPNFNIAEPVSSN